MLKVFQAQTADHYAEAGRLFEEYAAWLGFDLDFQCFSEELAHLPGPYAPPAGCVLLAADDGDVAGCVALRKLNDRICEMKHLYVRPRFRGQGIGRVLAEKVIYFAKRAGYERMRLDTIKTGFDKARALYRSLGFREIAPYYHNPVEGAEFLELVLTDDSAT